MPLTEPGIVIAAIAGGAVVLAPTVTGVLNIMANNRNAQVATALAIQQADAAARRDEKVAERTGHITTALEGNAAKLEQVHVLVNSRLSKALDEIALLRIQVSKLKRTRSAEQEAVNAVADAKLPALAPEVLPDVKV